MKNARKGTKLIVNTSSPTDPSAFVTVSDKLVLCRIVTAFLSSGDSGTSPSVDFRNASARFWNFAPSPFNSRLYFGRSCMKSTALLYDRKRNAVQNTDQQKDREQGGERSRQPHSNSEIHYRGEDERYQHEDSRHHQHQLRDVSQSQAGRQRQDEQTGRLGALHPRFVQLFGGAAIHGDLRNLRNAVFGLRF